MQRVCVLVWEKRFSWEIRERYHEMSLFISLRAQRNEPKKGHPCHWSRRWRDSLRSSKLPGCCKLAALKQCNLPFRQLFRCSAAGQWDFFSFPHLSCRASQTGAEKTREVSEATQWRRLRLFEGEARVFPRPALDEKQGKPAGPGLAGVPFSCFFFWARKRRKRENYGKAPFSPPSKLLEEQKICLSCL
jgi:hypothetical protein